jgi:hypothetical protein
LRISRDFNCTLLTPLSCHALVFLQVRGAPVVGFFLDHPNYANNSATSYTAEMQYLYRMQNLTFGEDGGLMRQCETAFPPEQRHNCVMSPHMLEFIQTPLFVFNSRCAQ